MKNVFLLQTERVELISRGGKWTIGELMLEGVVFPTRKGLLNAGLLELDGKCYSLTDICPSQYVNCLPKEHVKKQPLPMAFVK